MAAALSAMRRAIMDMASLADLVLLGMGSGSIDHRYPGQLQRPPIINRPASSRIRPVGIRRWGDYRRGPPAIRSHDRSARRHLATDSPLEGTGFEPSVSRQEKWSMPSSSDRTRVGRTLTLGGGAESSLEGRDIELSVSPKDIRTSPYDLCAKRSDRRQSGGGPMVRIHFPPAGSQQQTERL